ncbi:unnamed protein product [Trichogramma brassicae]|uniref:Integrase zinc-binding domain-containing protein n=1 Tax=Trichogramma brassicae TaxID=86971 RepID=A0A6H5IRL8_9HYME|nr:unnamed protein product [Trichogramma brassicae]
MRRGCKRRKRRRASATRGKTSRRIHSALAKLASRGRQPVSLPIRPAPRSDHRLRGRLETGRTASAKRESHARRSRYHTSAGHLGIEKTFDRVKREYYWRGMYHDVHEYVRSCDTCQRYKIDQTGSRVDLWGDALSSVLGP